MKPRNEAGIDRPLIERVVTDFYASVRRDPLLGPIFAAKVTDWPRHEALIVEFWASLLLLTGEYKGTPLQAHNALPGLDESHFRHWLHLFHESVSRCCDEFQARQFEERASRIARSFLMARAYQSGVLPLRTDAPA